MSDAMEERLEYPVAVDADGPSQAPVMEPSERAAPRSGPPLPIESHYLDRATARQIRVISERLAGSLAIGLSATVGTTLTTALEAIEETTGRGFGDGSPACLLFTLRIKSYHGPARLALSPELVALFLDRLLGAGGQAGTEIRTELTTIESSVLEMALQPIVNHLTDAWSGLAPLEFSLDGSDVAGEPTAGSLSDEPLLAVSIRIGEGESNGLLKIAVPWLAVVASRQQGARPLLANSGASDTGKSAAELIQNLRMTLEAHLRGATVQAGQMLALKQGDVLNLGYPVDRPFQFLVNGKCKYTGRLVNSGSRISLRIDALVADPDA